MGAMLEIASLDAYYGRAHILQGVGFAMRRGEVQGILGSRSTFQQFVDEGNGRFIAQIGGSQTDVPQLATMVDSDAGKKAVALIAAVPSTKRELVTP